MQLWKHLLPIHKSISTYGVSALMMYCTKSRAEELEKASKNSKVAREYVLKAKILSEKLASDLGNYQSTIDLKNLFSEALMYVRLSKRGKVERITESDDKSPDFKFNTPNNYVFIENKALNMSGGICKHAAIMEEGLENKIEMQKRLEAIDNGVVFSEQEIQPYSYAGGENYDQYSTRLIIETLTNKAEQNLKKEQFTNGQTILLLDFSDQLHLHDSGVEHSQKTFIDPSTKNTVSGELWYLAFGKVGDQISKHIAFEGLSNDDGWLQTSGLLVSYPWIKALIVHYENDFIGFVLNKNGSAAINNALRVICSNVVSE